MSRSHTSERFKNPTGLHDPTPFGYSHTARVPASAELVLVSGQYGSKADGSVVSPSFEEQVQKAFENLGIALAAHDLGFEHVVQLRTYVVNLDPEKLGAVAQVIGAHWGQRPATQTLLGVACLAMPEMLFEVEAVTAR